MSAKFLILGTIAAGLTLFVWGIVNHTFLPFEKMAVREFSDSRSVVDLIRAHTHGNGMYFANEGLLAAVAFRPDLSDKTKDILPMLLNQLLTNLLAAFLLAAALLAVRPSAALGCAAFSGLIGLAAFVSDSLPPWNWYGFSPLFTGVAFLDTVVGWFLAGLVLGFLKKKFVPKSA